MIYSAFSFLERHPLTEALVKEVGGINTPKMLITRSEDEWKDVAFNELGNTGAFFGGGLLLDRALNRLYKPGKGIQKVTASAKNWRNLGKSVALGGVLASMIWAMPFFRNYMTARRTQSTDYTEVIGNALGHQQHLHPYLKRKKLEQDKAMYLQTGLSILGIGTGIAAAGLLLSKSAIKRGLPIGKAFAKLLEKQNSPIKGFKKTFAQVGNFLHNTLSLKDGKFSNFSNTHTALFWGFPAYAGWIQASRDPFERKEQVLKGLNFFVWFFALPAAVKKGMFSRYPKQLVEWAKRNNISSIQKKDIESAAKQLGKTFNNANKAKALKLWGQQNALSLAGSIVLLGVSPAVFNIWLTDKRIDKAKALEKPRYTQYRPNVNAWPVSYSGGLHRKPFKQFAQTRYNGQ